MIYGGWNLTWSCFKMETKILNEIRDRIDFEHGLAFNSIVQFKFALDQKIETVFGLIASNLSFEPENIRRSVDLFKEIDANLLHFFREQTQVFNEYKNNWEKILALCTEEQYQERKEKNLEEKKQIEIEAADLEERVQQMLDKLKDTPPLELPSLEEENDLLQKKLNYLYYRIDAARKELEDTSYKAGGAAYRHLDKALSVCDRDVYLRAKEVTYEEMRGIEEYLLNTRRKATLDSSDNKNP